MLDSLTVETRSDLRDCVLWFFEEHGHELARAAARLGGFAAEARVVSCAIDLKSAPQIDRRPLSPTTSVS